jgi:hypothetical protein
MGRSGLRFMLNLAPRKLDSLVLAYIALSFIDSFLLATPVTSLISKEATHQRGRRNAVLPINSVPSESVFTPPVYELHFDPSCRMN